MNKDEVIEAEIKVLDAPKSVGKQRLRGCFERVYDAGVQSVYDKVTPCGKNILSSICTKYFLCSECGGRAIERERILEIIDVKIAIEEAGMKIGADVKAADVIRMCSQNVSTLKQLRNRILEAVENDK